MYEFPLTPTLVLSFQRYPLPESPLLRTLPRSWGALPLARARAGRLEVPVPDGEGVWLGLDAKRNGPASSVAVIAELSPQGETDALTGQPVDRTAAVPAEIPVLPPRWLPGVAHGRAAWWPLTRVARVPSAPACHRLEIRVRSGGTAAAAGPALSVDLLDPAEFTVRTGTAVPTLRPDAPYGGRRLP